MSGEQLRHDAQYGRHKELREALKNRANTASADQWGLTPLMYAVWNGHVECVKYLVCSNVGIDAQGIKVNALHARSCKGYTALHLAALDAPKWCAKELTRLLLIAGLDRSSLCNEGHTPEALAAANGNEASLAAFTEFDMRESNSSLSALHLDIVKTLQDKYTFIHDPTMNVEETSMTKGRHKTTFSVPEFLYDKQRVGFIPEGMRIHENQIDPLRQEAFNSMKGIPALRALDFSVEQADINRKRREKLLLSGDVQGTWAPVDTAAMYHDKTRALIRAKSPYDRKRRLMDRQRDSKETEEG